MKQLSVVIAAGSGPAPVLRCIHSLEAAGARDVCEVVVVARIPVEPPAWVRVLTRQPESSFSSLRAAGLQAAHAPRVAILSEDYTVDGAWLTRALAAGEEDVVAGVTAPSPSASLPERAAWLWEYAHLAPPMAAGALGEDAAAEVPAGNVVYRRERIDPELLRGAHSELDYHRRLHRAGASFRRDPAMVAVYNPPPFARFVRDRARWSASWASGQAAALSPGRRRLAGLSRALLPPLLLARFAGRIARRPRYWLTCCAALPLFAVYACAQAYGEASAYLEHG